MTLRKLGKVLLYACAGIIGVIIVLLLAVKLALDRAPQYQAEIKDWVHRQIGYHIAFTHVSPAFRWYGPELYFDHLELRSKDDQRVLARAWGGRVGADIWQLFSSGKLLAGRIELDSPTLAVARLGPDKFALAGEIELGGADSALPSWRLNDLPAGTIAIRRGHISVQGWNDALPTLDLRDVTIDLRRRAGMATIAVTSRLPGQLGGDVNMHATARGVGAVNTLSWTALVRAGSLSLAGWRDLLPQYLSRLAGGSGGFELAARGSGTELTRVDLDCSAVGLTAQLGAEPAVKFDQVAGAFTVTHHGERWTLLGRRVRAVRAGHSDPESQFDISWRETVDGLLELKAGANYLRAETLLPLAGLLPQRDLRERLQVMAPTGEWLNPHVELERSAVAAPWRLAVEARFRGVGFAPVGRAPGLRGLNGYVAGTDAGGRVDIDTHVGVFAWPMQFTQPVAVDNFKTTLYWKLTADELLVATPAVDLKTRDASLSARVAWHQPLNGDSPVLVLVAGIDNGNVAQTSVYLPRAQLRPTVVAWLDRAFVAGHLPHADIVLNGPIRHFPFRDGSGLFFARAQMNGLTLDYHEGWPRAENLAGTVDFRNEGMSAKLQSGNIGNMQFRNGEARFADFKTGELQLRLSASGDAADALGYLRATPLDALAEHVFSGVEARGPMQADLDLFLPFKAFDQRRILVYAHLHGVELNRQGSATAATELEGDVDVDGAQVARADVRGKLLGGSFQMQARAPRTRPVTRTMLVFNGTMTGDTLRAALALPATVAISGSTDWHGVLRMAPEPARERTLRINSSLTGLELNLPEPLAKPAGRALPSSVDILWPSAGGPQLRIALGSVLRGQVNMDTSANGPTLGRAAVTFGTAAGNDPAFSDNQIVNTGGTIQRLDLAGWLKLYTPDKSAKPLANFLRSARFEVAQIDYLGFSFMDVVVDLAAAETGWKIGVGGPNVVGSIMIPGAPEVEPWKLEFQRLKFVDGPAPTDSPTGTQSAAVANPRHIPPIDFHAADTIWGDRQFGDVRASLTRLEDGIGLKQLTIAGTNFMVNAQGEWRGRDAGLGRIHGTLVSTDVGGTLKQLSYADVIEAKTGKMDFDLRWVGAPTADALSVAAGEVKVALDKGQVTGLNPGAGRMVGLASVAALPRRLALDFSDLTDKGLAFDTVRGDFELRDGSAFTDNVLVKGPAAEIGLIGRVGLKNKDYDQTAVVTGNVSSSLPLAAFAGGPVIGAAVLVFTQVFKQPLKGLARGYYRITGNWDSPNVERIKSADAAASAEAPK